MSNLSEAIFQKQIIAFSRRFQDPNAALFHIPNGEQRNAATGAKLKKMGVLAGAPDLCLIAQGRVRFMELKRSRQDKLTPSQEAFRAICAANSIDYVTCHDFNQAIETLGAWGAYSGVKL